MPKNLELREMYEDARFLASNIYSFENTLNDKGDWAVVITPDSNTTFKITELLRKYGMHKSNMKIKTEHLEISYEVMDKAPILLMARDIHDLFKAQQKMKQLQQMSDKAKHAADKVFHGVGSFGVKKLIAQVRTLTKEIER